jgi:hypothetical protein
MFKRRTPRRSAVGSAAILLSAAAALSACGRLNSASSDGGSAQPAGSPRLQRGEVVITGAVNKRYTPQEINAVRIADRVGINLNEKEDDVCGVSMTFPGGLKQGTYQLGDQLHSLRQMVVVDIYGEYGTFCDEHGSLSDTFQSTQGTLTLTASGAKFSGTFQFAAAQIKDESKTIQVSGSFDSVPRP